MRRSLGSTIAASAAVGLVLSFQSPVLAQSPESETVGVVNTLVKAPPSSTSYGTSVDAKLARAGAVTAVPVPTGPDRMTQNLQTSFKGAAAIIQKATKSRVFHIERVRGVYYVTVRTTSGYQTHCVKAEDGKYLGRC